ncbi:hypothetical protein HCJ76_44290 [Streptomyces sp. MC1]|uniref:hypothetical protein n=1 Tax=Streptomyces sp. MC1 TaxID=295105 RepID=UPI0018CB9781|nr:hypothetical protein [Streptomyces sp. MC1]MBG7704905.1 hypothetical protein [Streptomyces sp. MC1]
MAAAQHTSGPEGEEGRRPRRVEPDSTDVAQQIALYQSMPPTEFAEALAVFVAAGSRPEASRGEDYELQACAIRSRELARKALRLLPKMIREPDAYLGVREGESRAAYLKRVGTFRSRAEREEQFLHLVLAGEAARKGYFLPDPNPRGRARRRLADEYPERFLELVREERAADQERTAAEAAARKRMRRATKRPAEGS